MAKRIDSLRPDEEVTLLFHGNYSLGNDSYHETFRFVRMEGSGDERRAVFSDGSGSEWEAYRYKGRWAYGSSAERLSVSP